MSNKLYQSIGNNNGNPFSNTITAINQFARTIKGDPRQMVEQMLQSGQMSQIEFNKYSQMAQQILPFMK